MTIDSYQLWTLPRVELKITDGPAFTCVICGVSQEAQSWRVYLPQRSGAACPGCASDHGFPTK